MFWPHYTVCVSLCARSSLSLSSTLGISPQLFQKDIFAFWWPVALQGLFKWLTTLVQSLGGHPPKTTNHVWRILDTRINHRYVHIYGTITCELSCSYQARDHCSGLLFNISKCVNVAKFPKRKISSHVYSDRTRFLQQNMIFFKPLPSSFCAETWPDHEQQSYHDTNLKKQKVWSFNCLCLQKHPSPHCILGIRSNTANFHTVVHQHENQNHGFIEQNLT